jgi:uncharacterized protein YcfJ
MNFQAKLIIAAMGIAALPLAQANDFEDFGRVVRVQPRVEQIRMPRQECRTEYVQVPVQQERGAGGGIVGGIVGGLLGNQVGSGTGRSLATVAGAVGGAYAGKHVEGRMKKVKSWSVNVRYENGRTASYSFANDPHMRKGDRVRKNGGSIVRS